MIGIEKKLSLNDSSSLTTNQPFGARRGPVTNRQNLLTHQYRVLLLGLLSIKAQSNMPWNMELKIKTVV